MRKLDTIIEALNYVGHEGQFGPLHNSVILDFFKSFGFGGIKNDETPWCSAFVGSVLSRMGIQTNANLLAISWLRALPKTDNPRMGDICVLWRDNINGPFGHVGFFIRKDEKFVYLLGGNQGNKVGIDKFPISRVLGYVVAIV